MKRCTRPTGPLSRRPRINAAASIAALTLGLVGVGLIAAVVMKGLGK